MAEPQSFKNHGRFDPVFHGLVSVGLLANIIVTAMYFGRHFTEYGWVGIWWIAVSVLLLLLALKTRVYALLVQDRVIRVEEKLRLAAAVSPAELVELDSLTIDQYIGLRFASNAELPDLARRAVREKLNRKQIKQAIVAWRADTHRV
ncbi:hypothetical protein SAMN05421819_4275 [Bryocella elongata]|uniref:Uncharacterized protein n=1 Tax=Bryocella elongata TaxID=863522 RepID=A0A1H6C6Z3_9BACT|nr:DUF6526 family protein [Bryocella elongata]SEG68739.1 hypothetical protein SAMN05421819_4275 [Bryocella elongata]